VDQSRPRSFVPTDRAYHPEPYVFTVIEIFVDDRMDLAMRTIFLIAWVITIPACAFAQPVDWQNYAVPETGATVDLPTTIFSKDVGPTDQGYGRRFMTSDGRATLAVQSISNVAHDSPAGFLAKKHPPPNIVYKRVASNFFVVSSFRNNLIWYDRCNFAGRFINCVMVNYPAAEKRQWDGVITRISNTLASR
jgi:hypothetical protein